MKRQRPSKNEQILSLIEHKAYELVEKYASEIDDANAYSEIFTITKSELIEYIIDNNNLNSHIHTQIGNSDGFYSIPSTIGFKTYEQYQGLIANEASVLTIKQVANKYVDYLIRTSGTGLELE